MRGLYRVSEGQTSGNGGTISAPVSAEFRKKQKRAMLRPKVKIIFRGDGRLCRWKLLRWRGRSQVSGIAGQLGLGKALGRYSEVGRFRVPAWSRLRAITY